MSGRTGIRLRRKARCGRHGAVVAFSIAILLLAALLVGQQQAFRRRAAGSRPVTIAKAVAQGAAVLGVAAVRGADLDLVGLAVHSAGYGRRVEGLDTRQRD